MTDLIIVSCFYFLSRLNSKSKFSACPLILFCPPFQVSVGDIVAGGAAELDGRLRAGDEILYVDGQCVIGASHRRVVQLMGHSGAQGTVTLGVRRRLSPANGQFHLSLFSRSNSSTTASIFSSLWCFPIISLSRCSTLEVTAQQSPWTSPATRQQFSI